jgi:hypothetical protein
MKKGINSESEMVKAHCFHMHAFSVINNESEMVKAHWGFHIPAFSVIHNESEMVKAVQEL